MEFWEQEQERIIKEEYEIRKNHVPISKEQQRKFMNRNWIEFTDEDGNKHYEPISDNSYFVDLSNIEVPKEPFPVWIVLLVVLIIFFVVVFGFALFYLGI
jgi:hypothetical protein